MSAAPDGRAARSRDDVDASVPPREEAQVESIAETYREHGTEPERARREAEAIVEKLHERPLRDDRRGEATEER